MAPERSTIRSNSHRGVVPSWSGSVAVPRFPMRSCSLRPCRSKAYLWTTGETDTTVTREPQPTMANNVLLTGPPGSGKTTVVEDLIDTLDTAGLVAGGVYCPEIRSDGERRGFEIVDILSGESAVLAHVDRDAGPAVGKYRVDVGNVDETCRDAFPRAVEEADFVVVDEIAPMEVHSDVFVEQVRRALDSDVPLVAVIHERSSSGFIGDVKDREDSELFSVTKETRDDLPETLTDLVLAAVE